MTGRFGSGLAALVDLLLPADCPGCAAGVPLCAGCRAPLQGAARPVPPGAGAPGPRGWAVAGYGGSTARLVRSWKDAGRHDLGRPLAEALAGALHAAWVDCGAPTGTLVVPVPTGPVNRRRRGADLVTGLAHRAVADLRRRRLARPGDLRVVPVLRHRRRVDDQAGLGAAERHRNLHGALTVPPRAAGLVRGRCCLVVDDVVTTGATVGEAARALVVAGARVPACAAVAFTPRHAGPVGGHPAGRRDLSADAPHGAEPG